MTADLVARLRAAHDATKTADLMGVDQRICDVLYLVGPAADALEAAERRHIVDNGFDITDGLHEAREAVLRERARAEAAERERDIAVMNNEEGNEHYNIVLARAEAAEVLNRQLRASVREANERAEAAEARAEKYKRTLLDIADWNSEHNTSSDWTAVIIRKAAAALADPERG